MSGPRTSAELLSTSSLLAMLSWSLLSWYYLISVGVTTPASTLPPQSTSWEVWSPWSPWWLSPSICSTSTMWQITTLSSCSQMCSGKTWLPPARSISLGAWSSSTRGWRCWNTRQRWLGLMLKFFCFLLIIWQMLQIPTQAYRKPGPEDSDSLQPS